MESISAELVLEKLNQTGSNRRFDGWSLEEQRKLLTIYLTICKNEHHVFDLIWGWHGCDSWEDIFRDYDASHLEVKTSGVEVAIKAINEHIQ